MLLQIFGIPEQYLVHLIGDYLIPRADLDAPTSNWIGYRVLSKRPYARAYGTSNNGYITIPLRLRFRLVFVGPQAEDFADSTMFWDDRADVKRIFDTYGAQMNYIDREIYSRVVRNKGFNDEIAWVVDINCQMNYTIDIRKPLWTDKTTFEILNPLRELPKAEGGDTTWVGNIKIGGS